MSDACQSFNLHSHHEKYAFDIVTVFVHSKIFIAIAAAAAAAAVAIVDRTQNNVYAVKVAVLFVADTLLSSKRVW